MSLSRLTTITGPGIATDTNLVGNNANFTGVTTTGTSLTVGVTTIHSTLAEVHNIKSTGIITATGANFSGNVSIGGTLTYEDVTNIDSVGIITGKGADINGDLDVDGHTNLDNVSVAGVTTFSDTVHVGTGVTILSNGRAEFTGFTTFAQGLQIPFFKPINIGSSLYGKIHYPTGGSSLVIQALNQITLKCWDGNSFETGLYLNGVSGLTRLGGYTMGNNGSKAPQLDVTGHTTQAITMKSSDGSNLTERFRLSQGGFNFTGLSTHTGNFDLDGDLDVDGHTNLDNVSVAGVSTFSGIVAAGIGSTAITLDNSHKITFGSANELEMYHDGSQSYIKQRFHAYPSALNIISENSQLNLMSGSGGNQHGGYENAITCHNNGHVKLYYSGTLALQTTGYGAEVLGSLLINMGQLRLQDEIRHDGDSDTKIRFPANDTISFETAGGERLRIDSSGRVLIGHSTGNGEPTLSVSGNTQGSSGAGMLFLRRGLDRATIGGNVGADLGEIMFGDLDGNSYASIQGKTDAATGSSDYPGRLIFATTADGGSSPVERLRITSDGDVDVATGHLQAQDIKLGLLSDRFPIIQKAVNSAGSQSLTITAGSGYSEHTGTNHVVTDARQGAMIQLGGGNPTSDVYGGGIRYYAAGHTNPNNPGSGNQHVFYTRSGVDTNTERFRISEDGQLLLGETTPYDSNTAIQFRKDVSGNEARFIFRNRANNSNSRVQLQLSTLNRAANADTFSGIEKYQNGGMAIYNGENTNQYSNINFFTNGWRSLQLRNGNHSGAWCAEIDAYWGTSNGLRMEVGGPQSGTWQAIDFHTSHTGTQRGYIGVTYGGVSYNSSSDYRMKQDVVDMTGAIDRIKLFLPKRFKWKEDPTHTVDGFLAHEAATVVPESVQGEKDGEQMQVMDNSKLVPVLTAALKEAIAKIEILETKVAALESS